MQTPTGTAVAGGVILASLIDLLVAKGVLSREEVGTILSVAADRLAPFGQTPDTHAARETISSLAVMYG
jgi:hypothetical protein